MRSMRQQIIYLAGMSTAQVDEPRSFGMASFDSNALNEVERRNRILGFARSPPHTCTDEATTFYIY